ncbi:hypothetical protein V8C86DRAFT_793319 [Haematococcus lacustris]
MSRSVVAFAALNSFAGLGRSLHQMLDVHVTQCLVHHDWLAWSASQCMQFLDFQLNSVPHRNAHAVTVTPSIQCQSGLHTLHPGTWSV